MLGFLGRLFGSPKAMDAAVDGISRGLDKLVYTKEEKAEARAADVSEARKMFLGWMDKTQGQNLARRVLAFMIAGTWLMQYFAMMSFNLAAVWSANPDRLSASADVIGGYADGMTGAMMLILGFYFAAPHIDKIIGPALARFGGRPDATS